MFLFRYVKIIDGVPIKTSIAALKKANPQVSFPSNPSDELLAEYGVYPLYFDPLPEDLQPNQYTTESEPTLIDGKWRVTHNIHEIENYSEISYRTLEEDQRVLRQQRNFRLQECDWTQLPDINISDSDAAAWLEYRQALRNMTEDSNFAVDPWRIEFPEPPA